MTLNEIYYILMKTTSNSYDKSSIRSDSSYTQVYQYLEGYGDLDGLIGLEGSEGDCRDLSRVDSDGVEMFQMVRSDGRFRC